MLDVSDFVSVLAKSTTNCSPWVNPSMGESCPVKENVTVSPSVKLRAGHVDRVGVGRLVALVVERDVHVRG